MYENTLAHQIIHLISFIEEIQSWLAPVVIVDPIMSFYSINALSDILPETQIDTQKQSAC